MKTNGFITGQIMITLQKVWVICLFISGAFCTGVQAQTLADTADIISNVQTLSLVSKHYGDSIALRWAPVKADYWYKQLHQPCLVARREVSPNPGDYVVISDSIRLMPEASLEQYASSHPDHPLLIVLLNNAYREWENSLYDGDIATMMEKASNFNNRWSLTLFAADRDPVVANAAGMRFVDKTVKKGVTYAYKVFIPGTYMASDNKIVHPNIRKFTPMIYQGFQRDSSLVIQWQKHMHDAHFSAYYIERAEDNKTFKRLNEAPYVQAFSDDPALQSHYYTYTDRVANGKNYQYRIIGLDAFGDESKPSTSVALKAKDLEPPLKPVVDAQVDSLKKGILISWTHAHPEDVKNYMVWYAEGGSDAMVVSGVLAADASSFFHQPEDFNGMGKYTVACRDADGNVNLSDEKLIRVPDFIRPAAPIQLEATTDSTGLIRVHWAEAPEKDIIGYFVYAADGDERHFYRLTPKLYPFRQFTDTVDVYSLTEKRFYTVIAVDDAMNYSDYSDTLEVERPDIMPPSPAWIHSYTLTDTSIVLQMVQSSSSDVTRHVIMRKLSSEASWNVLDTILEWPLNDSYADTSVTGGQTYIYTLLAFDEKGLASKSVSEKHILTPIDRSVDEFGFVLVEETDGLPVIRWNPAENMSSVQIYIKQKTNWQLLSEIDAGETSFKLKSYAAEPLMSKVVFADGSKSKSIVINQ